MTPVFAGRIAFIEDYDINVCRHLIQGVDVWLNNPRQSAGSIGDERPKDRSQRCLNCSILDGWWAEAIRYEWFRDRKGTSHVDDRITDRRDAEYLYETLEQHVIQPSTTGIAMGSPRRWIKMMMSSNQHARLAFQ